jgi:hypothetical protein
MIKFESYKLFICVIAMISVGVALGACSSSTDPYQPFVGDENIEYSQKPADVIAQSGKNRVLLKLVRPASPLVKKAGIFWNSGNDSLKVDFPADNDTLDVSVPGLTREGSYSLDIYTYNGNGENRSVATTINVTVYGDIFANSIVSRELTYLDKDGDDTFVYWEPNPEGAISTVLKYTNSSGEADSVVVPPESARTQISLSADAESVSYYSLYKPGASIDTFEAPTNEANIAESTGFLIYYDSPREGWTTDASDDVFSYDVENTEQIFTGEFSTKIDFDRFGIMFFNAPELIDLSNYSTLRISIYASPEIGSTIRVATRDPESSYGQYRVEVNTENKETWRVYDIPISSMGDGPTVMNQLIIQTAGDEAVAYVDEIVLLP